MGTVSTERIVQHISTSGLRKILKELETEREAVYAEVEVLNAKLTEMGEEIVAFSEELDARMEAKKNAKAEREDDDPDTDDAPKKLEVTNG